MVGTIAEVSKFDSWTLRLSGQHHDASSLWIEGGLSLVHARRTAGVEPGFDFVEWPTSAAANSQRFGDFPIRNQPPDASFRQT